MQFPPIETSATCGWVVVFKAEVGCVEWLNHRSRCRNGCAAWSNLVSHLLVAADATIDWLRSVTGVGHVVTTCLHLKSHIWSTPVRIAIRRNIQKYTHILMLHQTCTYITFESISMYFNVASDSHIYNIQKYTHLL